MWFKKKKNGKLVTKKELFEVGVTTVKLNFEDGREFYSKFYGYINQFSIEHSPSIFHSEELARLFLKNIRCTEWTYQDYNEQPTKTIIGKVIFAEIKNTEPFKKEFSVCRYEE